MFRSVERDDDRIGTPSFLSTVTSPYAAERQKLAKVDEEKLVEDTIHQAVHEALLKKEDSLANLKAKIDKSIFRPKRKGDVAVRTSDEEIGDGHVFGRPSGLKDVIYVFLVYTT